MVLTVEELKRLEDTDIRDLKREELDNAGDIEIDRSKPAHQRMREFLEKTKNPYAVNVGEYILQVTYLYFPHLFRCGKYELIMFLSIKVMVLLQQKTIIE